MMIHGTCENGDETSGMIANIERYALNDGYGVRTTVFLKGCSLRCRWCCNPETQELKKELMFFMDNCIACDACIESCPYGAMMDSAVPNWNVCMECSERHPRFPCVSACYAGCRKVSGQEMTVEEVISVVKRDMNLYLKSGGGVTVSGGEPLLQPKFLLALLQSLKKSWMSIAIETCGAGQPEDIVKIVPYIDMAFFDLKSMDDRKHKLWTGAGNKQILDNFRLMVEMVREYSIELIVRTPVIPGFNDSVEDISAIGQYIKEFGGLAVSGYELLPYHKLGRGKYKAMGKPYKMEETVSPSQQQMERLNSAAGCAGVDMCKF